MSSAYSVGCSGSADTPGASAAHDIKIVQATDAAGIGAKNLTGTSNMQPTKVGTDDDKQAIIDLT